MMLIGVNNYFRISWNGGMITSHVDRSMWHMYEMRTECCQLYAFYASLFV